MIEGISTTNYIIGDSIFNCDSVRESLNNDFINSIEAIYWEKRSKNKFKKIDSYRSFSNKKNRKLNKRLCENRFEFKRSKKWYGYEDKYLDYEAYSYEMSGLTKVTPQRNKVYCPCCSKYKIVFQEKSQADNFIKFNGALIFEENGYAPVRSYFCSLCGGWHVTSLEEDPTKQSKNELCLAERVVMKIIERKSNKSSNHTIHIVHENTPFEDEICRLLKEIKSSFNQEMEKFFTAYRNKDLNMCKEIHSRMKEMFFNCQLPYKEIDKIKQRITAAQVNIEKLSSLLLKEEQEKNMLIWGIQQLFNNELDKFKHAYALRKLGDCCTIYLKIATAVNDSGINLPFIMTIKKNLSYMEECLENLIELKHQANLCLQKTQGHSINYLKAV